MEGWGGSETNLHGVEMVHNASPDGIIPGRVSAVTFIGDNQIKGMDGNVQLIRLILIIGIASVLRESGFKTKEVDGHPLDGGNVDKGMGGLRCSQIGIRQHLGIEGLVLIEILTAEALAVDLIFLIELMASRGIEGCEFPNCLGRQGPSINQKENPSDALGLEETIDLRDGEKGLAGSCGHGHKHGPLALADGRFDSLNRLFLVWSYPLDVDGGISQKSVSVGAVVLQEFFEGLGGMEME